MTHRRAHLATAALAGSLTLGLATPVLAAEAPEAPADAERQVDPNELAAACDHAIERRFDDLAIASQRLDDVQVLTDDHEAALDGIIDATVAGLSVLQADIAAAPDVATTLRLCHTIAPGYRVYLVVLPQAHLTVGADRVDAALEVADTLAVEFQEAIDRAVETGADVTEAVALFEQARAHVATADAANEGVVDEVLGVTPASWNEGSGRATLDAARSDLRTARTELRAAEDDGRAALAALRGAIGDTDAAT